VATIRLFANFRAIAGPKVEVPPSDARDVRAVVEYLLAQHPRLAGLILDDEGNLQRFVTVFIDGRDVRYLDGLATIIPPNARVAIFPPSAGGA
jgi:sulfur-carrier protein